MIGFPLLKDLKNVGRRFIEHVVSKVIFVIMLMVIVYVSFENIPRQKKS